ncbi:MAG: hypothetical protein IKR00_01290 [Lachnospiraceae bacterium]|nr:hypothetical protein [Lachnospiraceae bacterium]
MRDLLTKEQKNSILDDFKGAKRESRKLLAALAAFLHIEELPEKASAEILDYIAYRKRAAMLELIRSGNLAGIRAMKGAGWIEDKYLKEYRSLANELGQLDIWALLYQNEESGNNGGRTGMLPGPEGGNGVSGREQKPEEIEKTKEELALSVFKIITKNLIKKQPGFAPVLETLAYKADGAKDYLAFDGFTVFYDPDKVLRAYLDDPAYIERHFLHMILHSMFFHPLLDEGKEKRAWDIACDVAVENTMDSWNIEGLSRKRADNRRYALKLCGLADVYPQAENIYEKLLRSEIKEAFLTVLENEFHVDSHLLWSDFHIREQQSASSGGEGEGGGGSGSIGKALEFAVKWKKIKEETQLVFGNGGNSAGTAPGAGEQEVALIKKQEYDYKTFLQDFMTFQEEVELDLDSFDYLPYCYSREHYDGMLIIEPLEYKEMHKLDELVIAIDTSGSCRGEVVRRFLSETWSILTEGGNFFKKMNVHIIQCDSMIQEHAVIRSREEFEEYMDNVTVKGLGGTDFRPVFELVNELIAKGELTDLKGLLYFTDGDGIYPVEAPGYTTAFIYLNKELERGKPPKWAVSLNLGIKMKSREYD